MLIVVVLVHVVTGFADVGTVVVLVPFCNILVILAFLCAHVLDVVCAGATDVC